MTTLNCPEEVELADKLIELHPWLIWLDLPDRVVN